MIAKKFIPTGVEDIHFNEYRRKENLVHSIQKLFKGFGYRQILTPTFEYYDLFSNIEGTVDMDQMIKMIDENGKILVLRPDVTTPIARMVAANYKIYLGNLKFSYVTNVFRMNDGKNDSKREFTQAGIEYLGNSKVEADGEVIALAIRSLLDCGVNDFKIDIGQINFFKGLLKEFNITSQEKKNIRNLVERKNFPELEKVIHNIEGEKEIKKAMLAMPYLYGAPKDVLKTAKEYIFNEQMEGALKNLSELCDVLMDYGYEDYFDVDLGLVNRLDYYTGPVFQGYILNHGKEILSGGRYDNLTQQYGYKKVATGFGLNVDELLKAMNKYEDSEEYKCYTDYLIIYPTKYRKQGLDLADQLRKKKFIIETDSYDENIDIEVNFEKFNCRNIKEIIQIKEKGLDVFCLTTKERYKSTIEELLHQ